MPNYGPDKEVIRREKELLADAIKKRLDREHSFSLRNSPQLEGSEILSDPPSKTALDSSTQVSAAVSAASSKQKRFGSLQPS